MTWKEKEISFFAKEWGKNHAETFASVYTRVWCVALVIFFSYQRETTSTTATTTTTIELSIRPWRLRIKRYEKVLFDTTNIASQIKMGKSTAAGDYCHHRRARERDLLALSCFFVIRSFSKFVRLMCHSTMALV